MKTFKIIMASIIGMALMTGCSSVRKSQNAQGGQTTSASSSKKTNVDIRDIDKVLYGEWTAMNVGGEAVTGDDRPYIIFDTVAANPFLAKFYAYNGCNVINGQVSLTAGGEMKKASEFPSTMKYCADAKYELNMTMLLNTIASWRIEKIGGDCLLYLGNADRSQTMVFRRSDLSWLNGAWQVRRLGDKVLPADTELQLVIDLPEKKVHGNTGCNVLNGEITTNPDKQHSIHFVNVATTRMMCPEINLEQQFLDALSQVSTAERNHSDNEADLRNAEGTLLMELVRIDLKAMHQGAIDDQQQYAEN